MTAAIFPAYGLARFVVSRPWAIAAAIGAVAAPPLAYAPYLLEEPLAYPFSTTALWAVTAAIARPTWRRLALAGALCLVAPFVRGELAVLLVVYCAGLSVLLWRTDRFTRWRTDWSAGDWVGAVTLAVGAALAVSAAAGHRSDAWYVATGFEKHRVLDHGLWSLGAMTIGLAVLPVVATVAAFASRRVRATIEGRAFVIVGISACVAFVAYAAVKGAYLSTVFSLLIVERNVIYLVPVVFAATAAVLARPIATAPALAVGFLVALLLVVKAEFRLDQYPYFEAPSLAIGQLANRNFIWDAADVERALVIVALVSVAAARGALVRALTDDRARSRRRRSVRGDDLGADDRDLRLARPQHLLRADAPDLSQARRLGRSGHGRRADALPRPAARQGHEPDLAARVLELRDRQDLEPRRHGAAAVALAEPREAGRHDRARTPA